MSLHCARLLASQVRGGCHLMSVRIPEEEIKPPHLVTRTAPCLPSHSAVSHLESFPDGFQEIGDN